MSAYLLPKIRKAMQPRGAPLYAPLSWSTEKINWSAMVRCSAAGIWLHGALCIRMGGLYTFLRGHSFEWLRVRKIEKRARQGRPRLCTRNCEETVWVVYCENGTDLIINSFLSLFWARILKSFPSDWGFAFCLCIQRNNRGSHLTTRWRMRSSWFSLWVDWLT